jgi:ankyrin repeat protein
MFTESLIQELFVLFRSNATTEEIIAFVTEHKTSLDPNARNLEDRNLLQLSVIRNDESLVNLMLNELQIDVNAASEKGLAAIHIAAQRGLANITQILLDHGANVNAKIDSVGNATPLILATKQKQIDVIKILCARKDIEIDAIFAPNKYNALQIAIAGSVDSDPVWIEIAECLTQAKTGMNYKIHTRMDNKTYVISNMNLAIEAKNPAMVSFLLRQGFHEDEMHLEGGGLLHFALNQLNEILSSEPVDEKIVAQYKQIFTILIHFEHININAIDENGVTPLIKAVMQGNFDIATMMVNSGRFETANLDVDGNSMLNYLCTKISITKNPEACKEFAISYIENSSLKTLKQAALSPAEIESLQKFLELDSGPLWQKLSDSKWDYFDSTENHFEALVAAFELLAGNPKKLALPREMIDINQVVLVKHIVNYIERADNEILDQRTNGGNTLLHLSLNRKSMKITEALLKRADLAVVNDDGDSMLHWALFMNEIGVSYLGKLVEAIESREDARYIFNLRNNAGKTAMYVGIEELKPNIPLQIAKIEMLLSTKLATEKASFLVPYAVKIGNEFAVKWLLKKFPEAIMQRDSEGKSLLHIAAENLQHHLFESLANANPDAVTEKDRNGCTPLHSFLKSLQKQKYSMGDILKNTKNEKLDNILQNISYLEPKLVGEVRDNEGLLPIEITAAIGNIAICNRVNVKKLKQLPDSLLHIAVSHWNAELVNTLVTECGMSLSKKDADGYTPFFNLVRLYEKEKNAESPDEEILHRLETAINIMAVRYPIKIAAHMKCKGQTATDILKKLGQEDVVDYIDHPDLEFSLSARAMTLLLQTKSTKAELMQKIVSEDFDIEQDFMSQLTADAKQTIQGFIMIDQIKIIKMIASELKIQKFPTEFLHQAIQHGSIAIIKYFIEDLGMRVNPADYDELYAGMCKSFDEVYEAKDEDYMLKWTEVIKYLDEVEIVGENLDVWE